MNQWQIKNHAISILISDLFKYNEGDKLIQFLKKQKIKLLRTQKMLFE